nr:hypothetical protein BaRGS_003583 [Batillaria attramentaria]
MINKRLMWHLESNNLITKEQTAFRKNRCTEDQLVYLAQSIENAFQEKKKVVATFIDLSKAFDKVWKDGLLLKLLTAGIAGSMFNWIKSFLCHRTARVNLDSSLSHTVKIREGVPQGGVISPTLFVVFINDISSSLSRHIYRALHADDFAMWNASESTSSATVRMQEALNTTPNGQRTGNEEADRLAKSGSRKEQPQQAVSYTEAKTLRYELLSCSLPLLDQLMNQVPGTDNYLGDIEDTALGRTKFVPGDPTRKLNTAYYHRWYSIGQIVRLTPLSSWNPYDLEYKGQSWTTEGQTVTAGGRNGGSNVSTSFNGTNQLEAIKKVLMDLEANLHMLHTVPNLSGSSRPTEEENSMYQLVTQASTKALSMMKEGGSMNIRSSLNNAHSHLFNISFDSVNQGFFSYTCDGDAQCWDGHGNLLFRED